MPLPVSGNVLIMTYWSYDDSLIQAYTLPYVRIIRRILPPGTQLFLLTLEKASDDGAEDRNSRIRSLLAADGVEWIHGTYRPFGWGAVANWAGLMARLASFIFSKNIRMIHCWGTPVGSIGYLLSLLTARKLTIDSYEPHAEAMVENGTWKRNGLAFQILFMLERLQTRRATHLIAVNSGMKEYARNKYDVDLNQLLVKPACVDLNLFSGVNIKKPHLIHDLGLKDKIVCVYAGKFGGIYLEKEVFDFLHEAGIHWGKKFRMLLLTSHSPEQINKLCLLSGVDPSIVLVRFVPHSEVADYMGLGDFGLTPVKPVPTKKYCSPIKDGEYWALGLPVVITSNISEDSDIIHANNIGAVLERLDSDSYKQAVSEIDRLLHLEELQRRRKIRAIATRYRSFEIAQSVYEKIYGG